MRTIKAMRFPLVLLAVLMAVGAGSLAWSAHELPPKMASHFDAQGNPNGWMSREEYLKVMGAAGLGLPLFLVGIGFATAVLPSGTINLPNRDYWLSPERRGETTRYLARHMAWIACLALAFFIALHWLVIQANHEAPPRLSNLVWIFAGAFGGGVLVWLVVLVWHFSRVPSADGSEATTN